MKITLSLKGLICNSCVNRIEDGLKDKVDRVSVSLANEKAYIKFDEENITEAEIKKIITGMGYGVLENKKQEPYAHEEKSHEKDTHEHRIVEHKINKSKDTNFQDRLGWIVLITSLIFLFIIVYYFFISGGDLQIPDVGENTGLILLFFVGILTGFHCIAMCGGFVVSYTTNNAIKGHKGYKQHLVYGGAKVISYALIGGLFGLLGGFIAFNVGLRGAVAIFAGLFMIFYALGMLGVGFFRRFSFNPKFLTKITHNASMSVKGPFKAPLITGLLSGLFIACGPLQAMYLYAAGTGSFINGSSSLAAFGLGTLPVMIGFGSFATTISHKTTKRLLKIAAIIVLILGIIMLNRGLTVLGSPITYDSIKEKVIGVDTAVVVIKGGVQEINMEVNKYGWQPNSFVLKKGVPVKWNINVKELTGCNKEIIVRDYGLNIKLKQGINVIEFTPDKSGIVRWSCWMGMIPGSFIVTDDGVADSAQIADAKPSGGGSCGGSCGSSSCGGGTGGGCGCGG